MTKVIVTITDKEDGTVGVNVAFDPPVKKGENMSPAQHIAMKMLDALREDTELTASHEEVDEREDA